MIANTLKLISEKNEAVTQPEPYIFFSYLGYIQKGISTNKLYTSTFYVSEPGSGQLGDLSIVGRWSNIHFSFISFIGLA